ncbi:MAG TPA: hypothetical protein DIW07_16310 [Lachnospiraceae bacterium]|nr:hypothetical protein [Lachnospiraceae bacterium]HCR84934.1 hypothetical protein [Lachnospiraceae bacterium]
MLSIFSSFSSGNTSLIMIKSGNEKQMEEKVMNEKSRIVLRLVAGLYLVYTGIKLIQGLMADKPANMVIMSIIAVVFIIVGAVFAIFSIKDMRGLKGIEASGEQSDEEEIQESEEPEDGLEIAEDDNNETDEERSTETTDEDK